MKIKIIIISWLFSVALFAVHGSSTYTFGPAGNSNVTITIGMANPGGYYPNGPHLPNRIESSPGYVSETYRRQGLVEQRRLEAAQKQTNLARQNLERTEQVLEDRRAELSAVQAQSGQSNYDADSNNSKFARLSPQEKLRTIKNRQRVMQQMEQAAGDYVRAQQNEARDLANLAQQGVFRSTVQLLNDLSTDTLASVNSFLDGLANGMYDGFYTPIQVAQAIYNDPTLITNLSTNIMNIITAGPGALYDAVHSAFLHVAGAVEQFETTMMYGNAEERGHAFGELGANIILGIAGAESAQFARDALDGVVNTMAQANAHEALGIALNQAMRSSEALAPEIRVVGERVVALDEQSGHAARGWRSHHRIGQIETAESANQRHLAGSPEFHPPYQANTQAIHFTPTRPDEYVRVHTMTRENAHLGSWMMKKDAIRGMTAQEIQIKYALPETPTHLTDVTVPAGHPMTRGRVRDILQDIQAGLPRNLHTPEGAVQYRVEQRLPLESFTNTRGIGARVE